ncbi:MAG: tetratricopeptide repeat protein [Actinobacteria bacterium]|uniref:Unannotated protein n=1 Tax=freshwater metagenome TaxID=449393 RepID=A0A6J7PTS9_9ZZZZ|nr:tetratricopeptide repeat protein [Actinomycetota bacterium]
MRIMQNITTADTPSDGVLNLKGDDNMAATPGSRFAESPSAPGRVQTIILAILAVLAVGAGGFALGRTTAPDVKSTTSTVTTDGTVSGASGTTVNDDLLNQALALHKAGNLDGASKLYNQILATDAKNKFALFNLGVVAQTNAKYDEAVVKYKAAIDVDPKFYSALYNLGLTYAAKTDRTNGIAYLRKAIDVDPKSAQAYFNLGTLLVKDGKTDEGTKMLNQAFALDPSLKLAK